MLFFISGNNMQKKTRNFELWLFAQLKQQPGCASCRYATNIVDYPSDCTHPVGYRPSFGGIRCANRRIKIEEEPKNELS